MGRALLAVAAVASALRPQVTVFGGSGFIGSAVCEVLAARDCAVVSVSRSGRPADAGAWADAVDWRVADASDAAAAAAAAAGSAAVVSCVGGDGGVGAWGGKASPSGAGDVPTLFASRARRDAAQAAFRAANGPPNVNIVAAAAAAGASRFAYVHVASDVETGIAGGIPGYFRGKGEALDAVLAAFPDALVVCPHAVYDRADRGRSARAAALDSRVARGVVAANRFLGNLGYRGEDLLTKVALTPPAPVGAVAAVLAAAATAAAAPSVPRSERVTRRIDPDTEGTPDETSREYRATARFLDGTDAIRAAAARLR